MAVGYRSILHLNDHVDAVDVAEGQLREWLDVKRRQGRSGLETSDWDGAGVHRLGSSNILTVVQHTSADARLRRALFEYVESNSGGVWTTRMYALSNRGSRSGQVIWFESEGMDRNQVPKVPATPHLVRNTLESVAAHDASVPILPRPRTTRDDDVDELLGYITDPGRYISIVVVAPIPHLGNEVWGRAVDSLTRDAIGCASFFVLDPAAHSTLNVALGPDHAIPTGAIRTFVPRVDLSDPTDARRHRMLTATTMVKGLDEKKRTFNSRIKHLVSITPRLSLLERELPVDLTRTVRVLQREQITTTEFGSEGSPVPASTAPPAPTVAPVVREQAPVLEEQESAAEGALATAEPVHATAAREPWFDHLRALVKRVLGRETVDELALQEIAQRFDQEEARARTATTSAKRLLDERERLENRVATLRDQLEAEQLERAVTEVELQGAQRQVRSLEYWRSTREDQYEYVPPSDEEWEKEPANAMAIIERLTTEKDFDEVRKYVSFTDPDRAIDDADAIDEIDPTSLYATSFWSYVLVLRDYCIAVDEQKFSGNMHMYLSSPEIAGRRCSVKRHRSNESQTVQNNRKWRKERTFTVPTELDPSGKLFMTAHFAPTNRDQNAPRLYYAIGKREGSTHAYIGYMGTHLTNTKTN